jgi:hypothetical protein
VDPHVEVGVKRTPAKRPLELASSAREPASGPLRLAGRAASPSPARAPELATLAGIDAERRVLVRLAGAARPVPARVSSTLQLAELQLAAAARADVLVVFGKGKPIVVALLADRLPEPPTAAAVDNSVQLSLDGMERTLTLTAREQLVLRCGQSSITLQRDGRVVVKGTRIETDAEGVNRIKGASVRIN